MSGEPSEAELTLAEKLRSQHSRRIDPNILARIPETRKRNFESIVAKLEKVYCYKIVETFIAASPEKITAAYLRATNCIGRAVMIEIDDPTVISDMTHADATVVETAQLKTGPFSLKNGQFDLGGSEVRGLAYVGENRVLIISGYGSGKPVEKNFLYANSTRTDEPLAQAMICMPIVGVKDIERDPAAITSCIVSSTEKIRKLMIERSMEAFVEADRLIRELHQANKIASETFTANRDLLYRYLAKFETKDGLYRQRPPQSLEEQKNFAHVGQCLATCNEVLHDHIQCAMMLAIENSRISTCLLSLQAITETMKNSMADVTGSKK